MLFFSIIVVEEAFVLATTAVTCAIATIATLLSTLVLLYLDSNSISIPYS